MRMCIKDIMIKIFKMSLILFLSLQFSACENRQQLIKKSVAESLIGDWEGQTVNKDGVENPLVAQIIFYSDDGLVVNLLEKFDTRDDKIAVLKSFNGNDGINVRGKSDDGREWIGNIKDMQFTGSFTGQLNGKFKLKKKERISPTLGLRAPEESIILLDGTNLDNWQHIPRAAGFIDLAKIINSDNAAGYLKSDLYIEKSTKAMLLIGSDDGVKVWLNNKVVHQNNASRGAAPDQDTIAVDLKSGWNSLLLKVVNGSGGWGAFARFTDLQFMPLKELAEKSYNSDNQEATFSFLEKNDFFLTHWKLAGPFKQKGLEPKDLFNKMFEPESASYSEWIVHTQPTESLDANWTLNENVMLVNPGSGSVMTKQKFSDFDLHVEFRSPFMPDVKGQKRGNSGVYIQGRYEIQVLDSYGLEGKDNECGGIYKVAVPRVNMCAPPGQWQTYDIEFQAAKYDENGDKLRHALLTVLHNGVSIYDKLELPVPTPGGLDMDMSKTGPILLQDHSDLVQYRNIWIVEKNYQN